LKGSCGNKESLSLWAVCEGNLKGVSFTRGPEDYVKEGSGDGDLSIEDPLGNLEGGSFPGDFEMDDTGVSVLRDYVWGTWEGGSVYRIF